MFRTNNEQQIHQMKPNFHKGNRKRSEHVGINQQITTDSAVGIRLATGWTTEGSEFQSL
jgi:hypothetical protein